jgi:hypothetical protein
MTGALRATAVALAVACSTAVAAAPRTDCHAQAVRDLERLSPRGHAVYRAVSDKRHFFGSDLRQCRTQFSDHGAGRSMKPDTDAIR